MFFSKRKPEFLKTDKISQFDVQWDWNSEISQNFQKLGFLQETMGFPKQTLNFLKMAKGIKFCVECNWKSKISQNVQTFGCYKTITRVLQKTLNFIWTEIGSSLKRFKEFELLFKNR